MLPFVPAQVEGFVTVPSEIAGVELTVTKVAVEVAVQPEALETVTVYEPLVVTFNVCVVAPPGDHK